MNIEKFKYLTISVLLYVYVVIWKDAAIQKKIICIYIKFLSKHRSN